MNLEKSIKQYFDELSSNSPTPGGGNVSALCGALSSALGTMVCSLTIGKKKYADVEAEMISIKEKLETYSGKFFELAQKDNEAFDNVMAAFKLSKETEADKETRAAKIEEATLGAAEVPSEVMKACSEVLPLLKTVAEKGNKNSLSDAGVGISLLRTAVQGAYFNVLINCAALSNQTIAEEIRKKSTILFEEIEKETTHLLESITKLMLPQ